MTRTLLNVVDVVVLAISLKSYIPTNETILCGFNEAEVHFEVVVAVAVSRCRYFQIWP